MWVEWYHQILHWSSFAISCDLKSTPHSALSSPWDVCCFRFLLFGTALFRLASWGDSKSMIPFWGLFEGSWKDERPGHLIFLNVSQVPHDMNVFNYFPLAWDPLVTETWLHIWFDHFGAILRILCMQILWQGLRTVLQHFYNYPNNNVTYTYE